MSPPLGLDVHVVCTGGPAALGALVAGLVAQTVQGFRLVLAHDGPGPAPYDDPAVRGALRVLEHRGNAVLLGAGDGPDAAPCTLLLDDDVLLEPDALARLLAELEQAPSGCVRPRVRGLLRGEAARCVLRRRADPVGGGT